MTAANVATVEADGNIELTEALRWAVVDDLRFEVRDGVIVIRRDTSGGAGAAGG